MFAAAAAQLAGLSRTAVLSLAGEGEQPRLEDGVSGEESDEDWSLASAEERYNVTSAAVVSRVATFCSGSSYLPEFCLQCLETSIRQAYVSNHNAFAGRLGIRNAVSMRTIDANGSEYILIDAPLQRRHTLLIDPSRLVACVCQDFKHEADEQTLVRVNETRVCRAELFRQFAVDFPRLTMFLDGAQLARELSPDQCLDRLGALMGRDLALQVLVLTTQGALAPIFNWVHSTFGDYQTGTHVTGGGCQEVHVNTTRVKDGDMKLSVELLLLKPFQVIKVNKGEVVPQTDLWCQTRLTLAPYQGGEVTLSVPAEKCGNPEQNVAIPITEGLLKMSPQHPQEPFVLTPSRWSWEMVPEQCEC